MTESPNHWWAISWTSSPASGGPAKTGRFWVSRAYPASPWRSTIAPVAEKGYGPNRSASHFTTSGTRARIRALSFATVVSAAVNTSMPSAVVEDFVSKRPMATVAR